MSHQKPHEPQKPRDPSNLDFGPPRHPTALRPEEYAVYSTEKMGKSTLFESSRLLVGLNAFEPGQAHALHSHAGMDKVYHVLEGGGWFLLEDGEVPMSPGVMLVAPEGVPHGIRNDGPDRLLVLAILAPAPASVGKSKH